MIGRLDPAPLFDPRGERDPRPLCPRCGCGTIRIATTVSVEYEVLLAPDSGDLAVLSELIGDAMWERSSGARCPSCGWLGVVGDLLGASQPSP